MNLNSKTITSTLLILLCGICVDGHAKSKKHKDKNKNKHTEKYGNYEPVQPKTVAPVTPVKEVAVETPKIEIEQPAPVEEVKVITYQPNHEEKIGKEEVKQEEIVQEVVIQEEIVQDKIVQEVSVDSMCESEAFEEHLAENTDEFIDSNT